MNHLTSRRSFLKSGIAMAAGLPLMQSYGFTNRENLSEDELYSIFQNPPVTARPFVRWWWNGDKLAAGEILRELDIMKAAGIGGVEINPIAFPGGDDLGIPSLTWMSPEWIEMVKVALKGAEERGMICDIIVGSGWPFGGEFLEGEERSQLLTLTSRKVSGPGKLQLKVDELLKEASPQIHSQYKNPDKEIYSVCLAPLQMEQFAPAIDLPFEKGKDILDIALPKGEHILYVLVKITGFQAVINGAPGAAGPVLNHYNPVAIRKFLNRMSDNLFPALKDTKGFRALFCDSMELEGANWCPDFTEEFKRRKGYDVAPYLPFILYKVGHMGQAIESSEITRLSGLAKQEADRVRYDFFVTCMDLVRDRFLIPYTQWCNESGFKSRVQPYGREFHPLESSLLVDIPECETWLWHSDGSKNSDFVQRPTYTNVNKFVSSAAHLSGKKVISCEEITNTDNVFNATLERIKITGDQSNLSGVTHSILHGFNYSPLEVPFPGWIRYGAFFNERNPWWPYFKLWADYKARLSVLLQETDYFADIAVMHPLADMWTKFGPQRDPFPHLRYPEYQNRIWEAIHRNGNSCDYTSEAILQQSVAENGYLKYNNRKYHTLMLLEVESMMPATAEALSGFVQNGGKIIFVGKEPCQSAGFKNYRENDSRVKTVITGMKQQYPSQLFSVAAPGENTLSWFQEVQQQCGIRPYVAISNPTPYVSQIRHQAKGKDIFFFTNCHADERFVIQASFPESKGNPWIWNPETGEKTPCKPLSGNQLQIDLPPAASQLIVFDQQAGKEKYTELSPEQTGTELNGWKMQLKHIDGKEKTLDWPELADLSTNEDTRSFAGEINYEKQWSGTIAPYHWIDLGRVYGVSEVSINGEKLGCHWYGRHLYSIPPHLARKKNPVLQVKITTTAGNYLKSSEDNPVGQNWTKRQNWQPMGMLGPVKLL